MANDPIAYAVHALRVADWLAARRDADQAGRRGAVARAAAEHAARTPQEERAR